MTLVASNARNTDYAGRRVAFTSVCDKQIPVVGVISYSIYHEVCLFEDNAVYDVHYIQVPGDGYLSVIEMSNVVFLS